MSQRSECLLTHPRQDLVKDFVSTELLSQRGQHSRAGSGVRVHRLQDSQPNSLEQLWNQRWPICTDHIWNGQATRLQIPHLQTELRQCRVNHCAQAYSLKTVTSSSWRVEADRLQDISRSDMLAHGWSACDILDQEIGTSWRPSQC